MVAAWEGSRERSLVKKFRGNRKSPELEACCPVRPLPSLWLQYSEGRPWCPHMSSATLGSASSMPGSTHQLQFRLPAKLPTERELTQCRPCAGPVQVRSSIMTGKNVCPCRKPPGTPLRCMLCHKMSCHLGEYHLRQKYFWIQKHEAY